MVKIDNRPAMGIAEGIRSAFIAIEVDLIKMLSSLTDSAAIDRSWSPLGFDVKAGLCGVNISFDDQGVLLEFERSDF